MTGTRYSTCTESRFHRRGRSLTLLSAPAVAPEASAGARDDRNQDQAFVDRAVLIVLPPGPEHARCYRLLRELAVTLASAGIPALRLELSGTGHSAQSSTTTRLADWHNDILDAAALLRTRWPDAKLIGTGVRYGARLLLDVFAPAARPSARDRTGELAGLVAWSPLLSGRDWVEHLRRVTAEMSNAGLQLDDNDLAGEPWNSELLCELQRQSAVPDLAALDYESTFLVDVDSKINYINDIKQIVTDISSNDWVSESLPMIVSGKTSAALLQALQAGAFCATAGGSAPRSQPDPARTPQISFLQMADAVEQTFCLGSAQVVSRPGQAHRDVRDQGLFGLYRPGPAACPAVVMLNSGLLGCSGPYRLYVETARQLAEQGIASVRFDFSGKGESPRKRITGRRALLDDYAQITDFLRTKGHGETILLGICSGADDALELAQAADNVAGVILLDGYAPKTAGYTRHYLQQRLLNPTRIRSWLQRKSAALLASAAGRRTKPVERSARQSIEPGSPFELRNWESPAAMRERYLCVLDKQCSTLAVFTGALQDDYYNHQDQLLRALGHPSGLTEHYLPHLGHLYPTTSQRNELIALIADWASTNFGVKASFDGTAKDGALND